MSIEGRREQNRRDFPHAAAMLDLFKQFEPRLIWAKEGGRSIGKVPE